MTGPFCRGGWVTLVTSAAILTSAARVSLVKCKIACVNISVRLEGGCGVVLEPLKCDHVWTQTHVDHKQENILIILIVAFFFNYLLTLLFFSILLNTIIYMSDQIWLKCAWVCVLEGGMQWVFPTLCYWNKLSSLVMERRKIKACFNKLRSVTVAGLAAGVSLHLAAVLHSAVVGDLHRFADVGLPAFQHLLFVQFLVHAERHQFGAGQPLPGRTSTRAHTLKCSSVKLKARASFFLTRKPLFSCGTLLLCTPKTTPPPFLRQFTL